MEYLYIKKNIMDSQLKRIEEKRKEIFMFGKECVNIKKHSPIRFPVNFIVWISAYNTICKYADRQNGKVYEGECVKKC